ncbi:Aminodeoxychorismate lyase [Elasticomyces elasticus]|nr:Aminodeoxychorismate lyase [Elasticomyces elasticus]
MPSNGEPRAVVLSETESIKLLTCIRYDPCLLGESPFLGSWLWASLHAKRIDRSLASFNLQPLRANALLDRLRQLESEQASTAKCQKVVIEVSLDGEGTISVPREVQVPPVAMHMLMPSSLNSLMGESEWIVYINGIPSDSNLFSKYKTTKRDIYNAARQSVGIKGHESPPCEVLLWNHQGDVMEGSITTPYFLRGEQYVTPALTCGGQDGVSRDYALSHDLCVEGIIDRRSLKHGEHLVLSNAVRGFWSARIHVAEQRQLHSNETTAMESR